MARLLWLPDVLRAAGLTVHEVAGWRTRGDAGFDPRGVICHETRGSRNSTDAGEIRVLLNGSNTAPPPIAQLYLSRTGDWHVVASGRCNHVRVGWAGPFKGSGNTRLLGIEAQHAAGEAWTDVQYRSYVRGVAAIVRRTGWGVAGHKEHQPGGYGQSSSKTDPAFNMDQFRRDVSAALDGDEDDMGLDDTRPLRNTKRTEQQALADAWWALINGNPDSWLARQLAEARLRDEVILAAVQGLNTASILARIDQVAAAETARDEQAARERAALAALVEQGLSGERDAAEVVRLIGELLTAAPQPGQG